MIPADSSDNLSSVLVNLVFYWHSPNNKFVGNTTKSTFNHNALVALDINIFRAVFDRQTNKEDHVPKDPFLAVNKKS
jgi:hypothetical protein